MHFHLCMLLVYVYVVYYILLLVCVYMYILALVLLQICIAHWAVWNCASKEWIIIIIGCHKCGNDFKLNKVINSPECIWYPANPNLNMFLTAEYCASTAYKSNWITVQPQCYFTIFFFWKPNKLKLIQKDNILMNFCSNRPLRISNSCLI